MKLFFIFAFALTGWFAGAQETAVSVIERSRNRIQADTVSNRSRMVLTARNGAVTERLIDQYSKRDTQGNNRTVIVFQEPASVRGTRFLTI